MRGCNITDPYYQSILVQCTLTRAQQEEVANVLEDIAIAHSPTSDSYLRLKAELIHINGKSAWTQVGELFAMPPMGGQRPNELLAHMKQL